MFVKKHGVLLTAVLAGIFCVLVYLRALSGDFVNLDDLDYVVNNPGIRSLDREFWSWAFGFPFNYWVPLLLVSFAVDYHFWGLDPFGYHLTNIVLHAVNTGLVVVIADRLYRNRFNAEEEPPRANYLYLGMLFFAALVFGIHPARVESVAWISERKDVLNGVFTLLSIICYLVFQERKERGETKGAVWRLYLLSLALFVMSIMTKPSSILIPAALLIIDWYPLGRLRKGKVLPIIAEKIPYLATAAPLILISIFFRSQQGGFNSVTDFPLAVRAVAAGNSLLEYGKLMVAPVGVLPYHALPRGIPDTYIAKAVASVVIICCIVAFAKKIPWLAAAVLSFVVILLPSSHFLADGYQLIRASRYTYLPSVLSGIIVIATVYGGCLGLSSSKQRSCRALLGGAAVAVLLFYAAVTQELIADWKNSGTMWTKVIEHEPFDKAYFFRGSYFAGKGDYAAAIADYSTCLAQASVMTIPALYNVFASRGDAFLKAGYYENAVADFSEALAMYPHPLFYFHRGTALKHLGRTREADEDFARAGNATGELEWID